MTIKREINGEIMEIELTDLEMHKAFDEVQVASDIEILKERLECWEDTFGEYTFTEDELRECAVKMRYWFDEEENSDIGSDITWDCIIDYLKEKGRLE